MTNTALATTGATKILAFPRRANTGGWEKLVVLGASPTGLGNFQFGEAEVPAGWEIRESNVSVFQKQLFDGTGKMIAKIFYKPTGGGGSLHVFLTEDDPMAHDAVIAAFVAPAVVPAPISKLFAYPARTNAGGLAKLIELGASLSSVEGANDGGTTLLNIPGNWELRESGVSPWQKRLLDGQGNLLALFFFKPAGGSASIHVLLGGDDPWSPANCC
jgi:hypothetical protein